ncbi:MAG: protein-L-isoaspartate O-methyltransferase family protein, partial [Phycisphaerales bacterium]
EKPYALDDDSIGKLLLKLAEAGLLAAGPKDEPSATPEPGQEAREDGEAGRDAADSAEPETEIQFTASDDCMEHLEALRAEVARRSPTLPEDLPSLLLLADANLHPAGFSSDEIMRALESPPAMLSRAEGIERYRGLMDAHWIFAVDRPREPTEWFPAPSTWALSEEIARRLSARADEMREGLATGIATSLGLSEESHLRAALRKLDRRMFVGDDFAHLAYRDRPVPIWTDRDQDLTVTTSSPGVCALIAHALDLAVGDRVLVCGVKGGFTAALCAHTVGPRGRVICLEDRPEVAEYARATIERAGLSRRVEIRLVRDVTVGLVVQEPWDAVVVNGKIPKVPRPIIRQMREGGRLLLFLQNVEDNAQTAYLVRKNGSAVENKALATFSFTPIYGEFGFDPPNWQENLNLVGQESHEVF